eukprot:EC835475.1.p1 GENE.EC835475.1~~EC835475.1.p1  ORF type:complete len:139 (+),score=16.33 EC835475.1:61-417(+)
MHGKKDQKGKKPGRQEEEKEWVPVTKLGRLVKDNKIADLHDIYYHALPIKEYQIVDKFLSGETLKDEVMKIMPVQKQYCCRSAHQVQGLRRHWRSCRPRRSWHQGCQGSCHRHPWCHH